MPTILVSQNCRVVGPAIPKSNPQCLLHHRFHTILISLNRVHRRHPTADGNGMTRRKNDHGTLWLRLNPPSFPKLFVSFAVFFGSFQDLAARDVHRSWSRARARKVGVGQTRIQRLWTSRWLGVGPPLASFTPRPAGCRSMIRFMSYFLRVGGLEKEWHVRLV